ncbi:MAG: iron exporter MbfA [Acetobacteraceae bacterium]
MRDLSDLSEREVLALAISNEEEDGRIYADIAEGLRDDYAATAGLFTDMAAEEGDHRRRLIELYQEKFGEHIPLIRRHDVRGFMRRNPVWQFRPLDLDAVRDLAESMELETQHFYRRAASRTTDASVRKLLGDLADAEVAHEHLASRLKATSLTEPVRQVEDKAARRQFVLRVVQPGLAGLMDGSVSTLAPVFASAFATGRSRDAFLVGLAASIGAGISMAFAEGLSDNGSLTGRGQPLIRGAITGLMTTIGGIGHTIPFLIPTFSTAMAVAVVVVVLELAAISWIRWKFMDTPPVSATLQVALGGALVFACGVLIGSS